MYVRFVGPSSKRRQLLAGGVFIDYVINQDKVTDPAALATVEELKAGDVSRIG